MVYSMEYYSGKNIQNNDIINMNESQVVVKERSQPRKSIFCVILQNYKLIYSNRKKMSGCLGTGMKRRMNYKGGVKKCWSDVNVYLDCGDSFKSVYIGQSSSNCKF